MPSVERRAFGRLEDEDRMRKIAVRCYGFTFVEANLEDVLAEQFGVEDWNRSPEHENCAFRAVVKDLIPDPTPFTAKMCPSMKRGLQILHRLGIYVMDVRPDNYREGLLLDFSVAWTRPHLMLYAKKRLAEHIKADLEDDSIYFDLMIDEANDTCGNQIWVRMLPANRYIGKLRPSARRKEINRAPFICESSSGDSAPHLPAQGRIQKSNRHSVEQTAQAQKSGNEKQRHRGEEARRITAPRKLPKTDGQPSRRKNRRGRKPRR